MSSDWRLAMGMTRTKITKKSMKHVLFKTMAEQGYIIRGSQIISPNINSKEDIRRLHYKQRKIILSEERNFFLKYGWDYVHTYFADGKDISPRQFSPELIPVVSEEWTGKLFRLTTLLWSIPVSKGYGRRMRFLVIDKSNGKLAGIIALGDPVFNLKVRDEHIGWDANLRKERLFNIMDAYVLGAVPPYNQLLVGKFLAGLLCTNEIRHYFFEKYKDRTTIIEGRRKKADLVLVTTTSALGKSSVYNRVFIDRSGNREYLLKSIGYTAGYGHFHVPDEVFNLMRKFLAERGEKYADGHEYGDGPNWKMRVIRKTMELLGYSKTPLLKHGIKREVFVASLASNYKDYLQGKTDEPKFIDLTLNEYGSFFRERFMIPRFERMSEMIISHRASDVYNGIYEQMFNNSDDEGIETEHMFS